MIQFKDNKNKSALSTRWAQMSKQEQIIEKKKIEIQAKIEAQKQAAELAAHAKLTNPTPTKEDPGSKNIFSNDGSFLSQYQALLQKQKKEKEKEESEKRKEEKRREKEEILNKSQESPEYEDRYENEYSHQEETKNSSDRHRRWNNDRSRNRGHSPTSSHHEDRKKYSEKSIPPLMQISVMAPDSMSDSNHWDSNSNDPQDSDNEKNPDDDSDLGPPSMWDSGNSMRPGPMPPMPHNMPPMGGPNMPQMGPGGPNMPPMGPNMPHMGPGGPNMPLMGPGGPNMPPMGPGGHSMPPMGPGGPNMPPMGPGGPNMPPMGPGGSNMPPMGPGGPNMPPMRPGGPNMPPSGPGGPNMPPMGPGGPMPPFMGGPNFPMRPNWGPNGPMPPNMCGPNGPRGPMPPFFGPPFMRPNGPPNSMMPPNSNGNMPFMPPRFGMNGPNFGNGPPMPFMPPNMPCGPGMPPKGPCPPNSDQKSLDRSSGSRSPLVPPPLPPLPKPDMDSRSSPDNSQVLTDRAVRRAADEVATQGDHWENLLKSIQDQSLWFLHNTNSKEYKTYRELVTKLRSEKKIEVKPEDKYEPEFCLDEDSSDEKPNIKTDTDMRFNPNMNWNQSMEMKREASSQSDEETESKRDHKRKKKSRWSDEPPAADIKPPGVMAPLPGIGGPKLAKIKEEGFKLSTVNRGNQALMQYAMTNYGTTQLSDDDWKKCEDSFKLNLLFQDMLKKRQEVERLAAAGKHKYEYDSDEDTTDGTWEHKLRLKEMSATEKWATELTKQAAGKHHIGDFLPPEELKKFMEKYSAVKTGKEPDLSDYKEFKLREDNVGFKMLQKLGWNEGQGLGAEGTGIVDPINRANQPVANMGLGAVSDVVSPDDDEFDAYRKRMMLAYRFRPNPLNNPRRPYY